MPAGGAGGAGAEFGRSRRLRAEEEREKKNVSFAPSVHQIEFDLDEEEEGEEEEGDDHGREVGVVGEQQRLRQLQQPLQGASWLREKLVSSAFWRSGWLKLISLNRIIRFVRSIENMSFDWGCAFVKL